MFDGDRSERGELTHEEQKAVDEQAVDDILLIRPMIRADEIADDAEAGAVSTIKLVTSPSFAHSESSTLEQLIQSFTSHSG